jgi:putative membrane protein insertion efficiency factor
MIGLVSRLTAEGLILLVRGYQLTLSPWLGRECRFHPTCSHYMIDALRKHGPLSGLFRGLWRICRCNPWGGSGHDPA